MKKVLCALLFVSLTFALTAQYQWVSTPKEDIVDEELVFARLFQDLWLAHIFSPRK